MAYRTQSEQFSAIVAEYRASGERWPATTREMAAWALRTERWVPKRESFVNQLAEQLSRAMREEYFTDEQGRSVRTKHAARFGKSGEQQVLWADIRTAHPQHMAIAFQQRRQQVVGDCRQLKVDVDSYNENTNPGKPIQMVFNFTEDLAELEALSLASV